MNITIIAICVICLVIAVLLDNKFDIPLGITSLLASLVICWLAFEMPAGKVIGGFFPSTIVFPLILAMIYFSVFTRNGTSDVVARKVMGLGNALQRLEASLGSPAPIFAAIVVATAVLYVVSMRISERIYARRDF